MNPFENLDINCIQNLKGKITSRKTGKSTTGKITGWTYVSLYFKVPAPAAYSPLAPGLGKAIPPSGPGPTAPGGGGPWGKARETAQRQPVNNT